MWRGSADRVQRNCPNQHVEIRTVRAEWIVVGRAERFTGLPPSVLADDDARIEVRV